MKEHNTELHTTTIDAVECKDRAILKDYATMKQKEYALELLKMLAEYRYVPREKELIFSSNPKMTQMWRLNKALRELSEAGFIKSEAMDCKVIHNDKDTYLLTGRGTRLLTLLRLEKSKNWESMKHAPILWRNRCMAELMFLGTLDNETKYLNSKELTTGADATEVIQYRRLRSVGFLMNEGHCYSVVYLSEGNQTINEKNERRAMQRIQLNANQTEIDYKYNRIIIIKDHKVLLRLINTDKNVAWLKCRDGTLRKIPEEKTLFHRNDEMDERGKAYVLLSTPKQKSVVKKLYLRPKEIEKKLDEMLARSYKLSDYQLGIPVQANKYRYSTFETDTAIVYTLIIQELHKFVEINEILKKKKEKRHILIYTTDTQSKLIEDCFGEKVMCKKIKEEEVYEAIGK